MLHHVYHVRIINLITWTLGLINQYILFKIYLNVKRETTIVWMIVATAIISGVYFYYTYFIISRNLHPRPAIGQHITV